MGVGAGLGGSVGMIKETTYGTYLAPTAWIEVENAGLKRNKKTKQGGGIAAGRYVPLGTRRKQPTKDASGDISLEVPNKGFGRLLQALFGTSAGPVQQAATAAYLQTHTLQDNFGYSLTVQEGVPQTDGTVKAYSYPGSKITDAEFSCDVGGLLMAKIGVDAKTVDDSQTLAAPSFPTGVVPRSFEESTVKIGVFGSEAAVQGVGKVSVKVERVMKTDRYYAGNAGLKSEPITKDDVKITGNLEVDFLNQTDFANRFRDDTSFSLIWEFVGPIIASSYAETFRIKLPMCFLDGDTPTLDGGKDVVSIKAPFTVLFDGTNAPITVEYMSVDTAY
jgi:hypothetical protein